MARASQKGLHHPQIELKTLEPYRHKLLVLEGKYPFWSEEREYFERAVMA